MPTTTLQKHLGHGGALMDIAAGQDNLYAILKRLSEDQGKILTAFVVGTIATATIQSYIAEKYTKLKGFRAHAAVCGTAGATTVKVQVNGVDVPGATITIDNADADGTKKAAVFTAFEVKPGDLVQFVVSAAPTGGSGLTASADLQAVDVAA
jgi:hypothetical protein